MESERYKIKVIGHKNIEDHTEFVISIEKKGINFSFSERYSNLKALNDLMKRSTKNKDFPIFPPKKFFGSTDEKFLIKRQQELDKYFETISNHPEFSTLAPLVKFIQEKKEKYGSSSTKNLSQLTPSAQLKKDLEKKSEKELKKSIKKKDEDFNKIVNDYSSQFYDMNTYYDKEMTNESNVFINYFNNNKISNNENNSKIESGNDSNFNFISQDESTLESIEGKIKEKIEKISKVKLSFDTIYDTKGIIVPI
jgi:hypothetical protein